MIVVKISVIGCRAAGTLMTAAYASKLKGTHKVYLHSTVQVSSGHITGRLCGAHISGRSKKDKNR